MPHIARYEMVIFPQHTGPRQRRAVGTDGFPFGFGLGSEAVWPQSHRRWSAGGMVRFFFGLHIGLTGLEVGARLRAMRSATAPGCLFQADPGIALPRNRPKAGSYLIGLTGLEVGARLRAMGIPPVFGCHFQADRPIALPRHRPQAGSYLRRTKFSST